MKKFTCLLVAFLAISAVYTNCPATDAENSMQSTIADYTGATLATVNPNQGVAGADADVGVCGSAAGAVVKICCAPTQTKTAVSTEITKAKNQYTNFGSKVGRFGAMMAKVATLVNASTAQTTLGTAVTAENSGATADQLKAFAQYTPAQYATDFAAFKEQVATCYDYHALAIQKSACDGCIDNAEKALKSEKWGALSNSVVHISTASCNDWATKCNKVWNFLHKAGWFIHSVAFLNKKKEATAGAVTFSPPTAVYPTGAASIADINTALASCGTDAAAAACTADMKANLCKSFVSLWSGSAGTTLAVGRSSDVFIVDTYNPTSTVTRRVLAATAKLTGAVAVDANGFDTTSANTAVFPPTTAIATITPTDWSSGYVAPTTGGSSGSSGTSGSSNGSTSSAKVVISTILSALFAIALLN